MYACTAGAVFAGRTVTTRLSLAVNCESFAYSFSTYVPARSKVTLVFVLATFWNVAVPGPLETVPLEDLRHQLEVNLVAYVAVTQAMLPQIRRAEGRIVFLASIGGRIAFPFGGPYHASKFATEAIGDVFRQELRPWGIEVAIIEPGSIDTPIWGRGQEKAEEIEAKSPQTSLLYGAALEKFRKVIEDTAERGIPPEKVAKAIAHALESSRPKTRYLVGLDAKVQARIQPFIPTRIFDRIVARQLNL